MNVAELDRLAGGARPDGVEYSEVITYLARRVIAAERMADAIRRVSFSDNGIELLGSLSAYEATK